MNSTVIAGRTYRIAANVGCVALLVGERGAQYHAVRRDSGNYVIVARLGKVAA